MSNSKSQLWQRFQQYYTEFPELGLALDISRMNFSEDFLASMEPRLQKAFAAMAELEKGGAKIISETDVPYSRKCLCRDLAISVLYTILIVALVKMGVIGPIQDTVRKIQHFVHIS